MSESTEPLAGIAAMFDKPQPRAQRRDLDLAKLPRNDYGNAQRLIGRFGRDLMYVDEHGWYVWDGRRWSGEAGDVRALVMAHQTAEAIKKEATALKEEMLSIFDLPMADRPPGFDREETEDAIKKHWSFAVASGNTNKANAMLQAAVPYLRVSPRELDADNWLLNVLNGTLELRHMGGDGHPGIRLREHRREDRITLLANVTYDPQAQAPIWNRTVDRVLPVAPVRIYLQTYLGLCLTGDVSEQKIAILSGVGANGKSTIVDATHHLLDDYAAITPIQTLMYDDRRSGSQASPDVARLEGKRLVLASEPEVGQRLSESFVKMVTSGEPIAARHLNKGFFEYLPRFKLGVSVNIKPTVQGQDHGIWRRITIVPFDVVIPEEERDKQLGEKLVPERSGILNWLLEGLTRWFADGRLVTPDEVKAATEDYRESTQPFSQFVKSALRETPGATVTAKRVYELYKGWCDANAYEPLSQSKIGRLLDNMGFKKHKVGIVYYVNTELVVETFKQPKPSETDDESGGGDGSPEPPPPDMDS
ncbi:MAG: hypothetical protein E6Q98_19950 [Rhodospirillaceae bacterium]|nr:MAG: hypothetical protein E6Q98_19950 [Rhodospirillaceae bacterium]